MNSALSGHSVAVSHAQGLQRLLQAPPSRCHHARHRAAAAAVCAQEPAAAGGTGRPGSSAHSGRQQRPNNKQQRQRQQHEQQHGLERPQAATWQQLYRGPLPDSSSSSATAGANPAQQPSTSNKSTQASLAAAALTTSLHLVRTWPDLIDALLGYSTTHTSSTAAGPTTDTWPRQQQQQQQQQQRQEQVIAALKLLHGRHLALLLKACVRVQPSRTQPSLAAAAAALKSSNSKARGSAAAGWSPQESQLFWSLTQLAFSELLQQLPSLSAWDVSSALWSASKLARAPSALLLRRLLQQLAEPNILAAAAAQDLSMSLYAVASLAVQVPEQQLDLLLAAAAGHMETASPQALSNILWAVATLQHRPQEQWLQQLEARCTGILAASCPAQWHAAQQTPDGSNTAQAQLHERTQQEQQQQRLPPQQRWQQQQQQWKQRPIPGGLTPQGLHQLIWAMARLQWQPSGAFKAAFWPASLALLAKQQPHGTSGVLWAVATLSLQPPGHWVTAWMAALQQQMQQGLCGPQDLGNALWAVVRLGLKPEEAWLQDAVAATEAVLDGAGTQELSNMLWALAKLGVRPGGSWMQQWLLSMECRMNSFCAPALASSTYALALLKYRPPRAYVLQLLAETQRQMPAIGAQELSNLVWALATLQIRPGAAWLTAFERQAVSEASAFNAQELSILFWSLAKLHYTPPATWVSKVLFEGTEVAGGWQVRHLVLLLDALTRWRLPEMQGGGEYSVLLPRYWAAAQQMLPECNLAQLSTLLAARVRLGVLPCTEWSSSFWAAAQQQLQQLVQQGQQQLVQGQQQAVCESQSPAASGAVDSTSSGGSGSVPGCDTQHCTAVEAFQALPSSSLQSSVVAQLVWAAGKIRGQAPPPDGTLELLLASAAAVAPRCTFAQLTAVGVGLRLLLLGRLGSYNPAKANKPPRPSITMSLEQLEAAYLLSTEDDGALRARYVAREGRQGQHGKAALDATAAEKKAKRRLRRLRRRKLQLHQLHLLRQCRQWGGQWQQVEGSNRLQQEAGRFSSCSSSSSSEPGATAALAEGGPQQAAAAAANPTQLEHVHQQLWDAWFARSTQLLLQAAAAVRPADAAAGVGGLRKQQQQQQQQQQAAGLMHVTQQAPSQLRPRQQPSPNTQQHQQQQQDVLGRLGLSGGNVAMHTCVVSTLWLRPSPVWLQALLAVLQVQLPASSPEALSFVLRHVLGLQHRLQHRLPGAAPGAQLPQGFVQALLERVRVLREGGEAGFTRQQVLRLQRGLRAARDAGAVSAREWHQWQLLLAALRANQGLQ